MKSFFNMPKPRGFRHEPIYFSPEKDALEKKISKIKREMGELPPQDYDAEGIKGSFFDQTTHARRRREDPEKSSSSRNIKLALALVVLVFIFYFFYVR